MDAAGQFLVDLEDLPDLAVLPSFWAPTTKTTLAAPQA